MEYFETFNADGTPANETEERGIVHARGLWHRTVHVWLYRRTHALLFQKRGKNKDSHPGLWDVSAAGHMEVGEGPEQSAVREVKEELGFYINTEHLEYIEKTSRTMVSNDGSFIDNEFSFVYLYEFTGQQSELSPNPDELDEIRFMEIGELRDMLDSEEGRKKFVPYDRNYYDLIISIVEKGGL
jgi:isopentenyldiphosphate isomerase